MVNYNIFPSLFIWNPDTPVSGGRRHDVGMLTDSGLPNDMGKFAFFPTDQPMYIYGDPAFEIELKVYN